MVQLKVMTALIGALFIVEALAHPGMSSEEMNMEITERSAYLKTTTRDLSHCAAKLKARGVEQRAIDRRTAIVKAKRYEVATNKWELAKRDEALDIKRNSGKNDRKSWRWNSKIHTKKNSHKSSSSCESGQASTKPGNRTSTVAPSNAALSAYNTASSIESSASPQKSSATSSTFAASTDSSLAPTSSEASFSSSTSSLTVFSSSSSASSQSSSTITLNTGFSSTLSAVISSITSSFSTSVPSSVSTNTSGGMPSGAMSSGDMGGGNSTSNSTMSSGTNSTGGAGQLASSISTYGSSVAAESHEFSNLTGITQSSSGVEETIFGNSSCILNPEGEVGPFYVTGELIRTDIAETQAGVPIYIDGQFIDVTTCEPIENLYWDIWHANSTGVYGGVIGSGNGNSEDTSNLNNTFLRGLQPTDADGVATFQSIFPGHYAGRATHIHVVSRVDGTVLANGTYSGGDYNHIGQLFFDQDLITSVNEVSPYSTNTIAIVDNVDDRVFAEETLTDSDPVMDYVLLGDSVSDGLFVWISMGIDPTASYTANVAAAYYAVGGVLE